MQYFQVFLNSVSNFVFDINKKPMYLNLGRDCVVYDVYSEIYILRLQNYLINFNELSLEK